MTERQFWEALKKMGYSIKMGKDITICPAGRERGLKLQRNFGDEYSLKSIRRRILEQARPRRPEPKSTRHVRVFLLHGNFRTAKRLKGFRALYFRYLYLLGKLPKNRQIAPAKISPIHRGELLKIDRISRELRLLCEHEIDTPEQLAAFKASASKKEAALCDRILFRAQEMRSNMQSQKKLEGGEKSHERWRSAEQVVRLSMDGAEFVLKIAGGAAERIAAMLLAALQPTPGVKARKQTQTKLRGRERLRTMLKSGAELKFFEIQGKDLKEPNRKVKRFMLLIFPNWHNFCWI
jgi:hypothetical protein